MSSLVDHLHAREAALVRRVSSFERRRPLRAVMLAATRAGDGWALVVVIPLVLAVWGRRGVASIGIGLVTGVAIALVVHGMKHVVKRHRPDGGALERPIGAPDFHAFPSGHTAQAFGLLVLASWLSPWFGLAFLPIALAVGLSRVFFALHYPTDVLAGALLGTTLTAACIALLERSGYVHWLQRISPIP